MTLKKLLTFALLALLVILASILGRTAFGEEQKNDELTVIDGRQETFAEAKDGKATMLCSDDKNAFTERLRLDVPRYRYYSYNIARSVYTHVRERYRDAALAVAHPTDRDIPDGYVGSFCVAFGEPRGLARNSKVLVREETPRTTPEFSRSTNQSGRITEAEQASITSPVLPTTPLARWNSALVELRHIARQTARDRDISKTERSVMEDGLKGVRDILDENETTDTFVESSFHEWNVALTELRAAATDLAATELPKSVRSAMKADLKDVENALSRKKSKKKFGVF